MSDEKKTENKDELVLDDILKEVSSWSDNPQRPSQAGPPLVPDEGFVAQDKPSTSPDEANVSNPTLDNSNTPNTSDAMDVMNTATSMQGRTHADVEDNDEDDTASSRVIALVLPIREAKEPSEDGDASDLDEDDEDSPPPPDNLIPFTPPVVAPSPDEIPTEGTEEAEETEQTEEGEKEEEKTDAEEGSEENIPEVPDLPLPPPPEPEPETILEAIQLGRKKINSFLKRRRKGKLSRAKAKEAGRGKDQATDRKQPSRKQPSHPDTPPKELVAQYGKELRGLRVQTFGAFFCAFLLLLIAFLSSFPTLPLPAELTTPTLLLILSLGLFGLCLLFSYRLLLRGLIEFFTLHFGMRCLSTFGAFCVLVDGLTLQFLNLRPYSLPLFAPAACVLAFQLWGLYHKTATLHLICRTASSAAAPDLMTVEPSQWNGKGVYRRRFGSIAGFGAQVQEADGAEHRFRALALLLLPAAILASVLPALASKQPQLIVWALSATLTASATLSGTLCFALPFRDLARRLSKLGVALAGWPGILEARPGCGLLVESTDLFPPGSISVTSFQTFGTHNPAYAISVTASLIRAAHGGLDPLFSSLLRNEGGSFLTTTELSLESEGISARIAGETVQVGNLAFLARMGIDVPVGVRVPTGVFCAIDGSFAAQFVLHYSLHKHAAAAMDALLSSRVTPVLIGLDFNLIPSVLKKLFRFPWDKMAFPELSQRAKLSRAPLPRESGLMALLCLQGLAPVTAAAVGAQRLHTAVRLCTGLCSFGAIFGLLVTAYLASAAAFTALTPIGLCLFLFCWFIPTAMVAGWVNQF